MLENGPVAASDECREHAGKNAGRCLRKVSTSRAHADLMSLAPHPGLASEGARTIEMRAWSPLVLSLIHI